MSEIEKMEQGLEYSFADEELDHRRELACRFTRAFNAMDDEDYAGQRKLLEDHLGSVGKDVWIAKGLHCDNGKNIFIGDDFTGNYNLTILDVNKVIFGSHIMVGPNVLISTVNHPLSPKKRRQHLGTAKPVTIGDDVWIGGNVSILPGVTIGNNVVIAAGAVVNKDIEDNSLVGGVPAKLIRKLDNDLDE